MLRDGTGLFLKSSGNRRAHNGASPICVSVWQQCLWLEFVRTDLRIPSPSEKWFFPAEAPQQPCAPWRLYCRGRGVHLADQRIFFIPFRDKMFCSWSPLTFNVFLFLITKNRIQTGFGITVTHLSLIFVHSSDCVCMCMITYYCV